MCYQHYFSPKTEAQHHTRRSEEKIASHLKLRHRVTQEGAVGKPPMLEVHASLSVRVQWCGGTRVVSLGLVLEQAVHQ